MICHFSRTLDKRRGCGSWVQPSVSIESIRVQAVLLSPKCIANRIAELCPVSGTCCLVLPCAHKPRSGRLRRNVEELPVVGVPWPSGPLAPVATSPESSRMAAPSQRSQTHAHPGARRRKAGCPRLGGLSTGHWGTLPHALKSFRPTGRVVFVVTSRVRV